jgi:hypothetical protein
VRIGPTPMLESAATLQALRAAARRLGVPLVQIPRPAPPARQLMRTWTVFEMPASSMVTP